MNDTTEVYLGDGLYASFDGYQIILRAPRATEDHFVALEPSVLQAFMRFVEGKNLLPKRFSNANRDQGQP